VTSETLLALGLIAVYLFDSMHFLRIGEAVIVTRRSRLHALSFGSGFEFGGRRPFLPNPLTPFWPELRVDWVNGAGVAEAARNCGDEMLDRASALRWVGVFSSACAASIVVGAPVALFVGAQWVFIACVAVGLACELVAAGLLLRARKRLGLGLGQWFSLALIGLICLPCAGNLARAAAKARCWTLPAHQMAQLQLADFATGALRTQVREALLRARRFVDEESPEFHGLSEQLRLLGEGS
jgi:membrane protease YdiL (CAAX protease family)